MNNALHGFERMPVSDILTGDIVMMHPEDQIVYRAKRERGGKLVLKPDNPVCESITYADRASETVIALWVKS